MIDYSFEYKGDTLKVPKGKIFEALYAIGEITPIATIDNVIKTEFMKSAKIFCILAAYAGQDFDPIEITKHFLYAKGGSTEIYVAIGGLIATLSPPDDYQPPEQKDLGK